MGSTINPMPKSIAISKPILKSHVSVPFDSFDPSLRMKNVLYVIGPIWDTPLIVGRFPIGDEAQGDLRTRRLIPDIGVSVSF